MFPDLEEMRRLRQKVGMSQQKLAEKVGISQSAITKYENGSQVPSYTIACKIFDELLSEDIINEPEIGEIMQESIISLSPDSPLKKAINHMKTKSISQIPIIDQNLVVGTVNESKLLDIFSQYHNFNPTEKLEKIMDDPLPIIPKSAKISEITPLLKHYSGILVSDKGMIAGIVTKADLLSIQ